MSPTYGGGGSRTTPYTHLDRQLLCGCTKYSHTTALILYCVRALIARTTIDVPRGLLECPGTLLVCPGTLLVCPQ